MARHGEARRRLRVGHDIVEHAAGNLIDATTALATDVLVVAVTHLEASVSLAEIDAIDDALALEQRDRAEHGGVVRRTERSAHLGVELVDRPRVPAWVVEEPAHLIGHGTRAGHVPSIARALALRM